MRRSLSLTATLIAAFIMTGALPLTSSSARAADADSIPIGLSTALTGNQAALGQHDRWGVELAISEINTAGGIQGRALKLYVADNQCNPAEAVKAAGVLLDQDKVVALLGCLCSSATLATMPLVQRTKIPFLVPISTAAAITQQAGVGGNPWVFKTSPTDPRMADALFSYLAKSRPIKRVAILAEDTDYGRGGAQAVQGAAKANGMEVVSADFFQLGTPDFTAVLTKLAAEKPDVIAFYSGGTDNNNYIRQQIGFGLHIPLTGRVDLASLQINAAERRAIQEGLLDGTTSVWPYDYRIDTAANKGFAAKFKAKYGTDPVQHSFYSYEATLMLAEAMKRAGSAEPEAVRAALESSKFQSALGILLQFDDHHQSDNGAVITEIKAGQSSLISVFKN
jgi:branched-chain amino acid transport system substrate-binding protein